MHTIKQIKKLFPLLLILPLFASCSDDKDDTVYLDNKLIEGSWYWIQASDSSVYTFRNNAAKTETFDKYTKGSKGFHEYGVYKLTHDRIIYNWKGKEGKNPYRLSNDVLSIMESSDGTYTDYIRVK